MDSDRKLFVVFNIIKTRYKAVNLIQNKYAYWKDYVINIGNYDNKHKYLNGIDLGKYELVKLLECFHKNEEYEKVSNYIGEPNKLIKLKKCRNKWKIETERIEENGEKNTLILSNFEFSRLCGLSACVYDALWDLENPDDWTRD